MHVHHWMVCALILMCVRRRAVVFGFALAFMAQGLSYSDRFDVLQRAPRDWYVLSNQ